MTDTTLTDNTAGIGIDSLPGLRQGELIEARQGGVVRERGRVDMVAPHLGVVWIVGSGLGTRRMLDLQEWEIRILPEP
ncbi:hypothetical protein [Arthrobacter mobilis]|uniref:Uncharacterized protein n=1 Tax=Arthrobacter mobilis TaxID=2724944 RepID=A0A7X6H9L0_9MICC|nr:hypothetical protein [Arthrobacter mobilis]NKX52999.1 hypothetical protein [Arthrobacter mobilis]